MEYRCLVDTEIGYLLDVNIYLGKSEENAKRETNIGIRNLKNKVLESTV